MPVKTPLPPLPPAQHDSHNPESGHGNEDGAILFEGGLNQKKAGHDNSHHSPNLIKEPCRNKNRGRKQRPEIRLCENLEGEPKEKDCLLYTSPSPRDRTR